MLVVQHFSILFLGWTLCGTRGPEGFLHHPKCYCGIEKSAAYSIENPGSDSEGEAKAKAYEKNLVDCGRSIGVYCVWSRISS